MASYEKPIMLQYGGCLDESEVYIKLDASHKLKLMVEVAWITAHTLMRNDVFL